MNQNGSNQNGGNPRGGNSRSGNGQQNRSSGYNSGMQPPQYKPAIRRVKRRSFAGPVIAALILTVVVIISIVFLVLLLTGKMSVPGAKPSESGVSSGSVTGDEVSGADSGQAVTDGNGGNTDSGQLTGAVTSPDTTAAPVTDAPVQVIAGYKTISVNTSDMYTGDLILVNYEHKYVFPDKKQTITIYGNKNTSYKLSTTLLELDPDALTALNDMMKAFAEETDNYDVFVKNAYRSLEDQQKLYDARVEAYGEDNAKKYLAQPGYSEHHTGLGFDLGIYTDEGKAYDLNGISGYADWFEDNCTKYGFVLRFPSSKSAITQITNEDWHFRYVGTVHAETMKSLNMCLEEYIAKLQTYQYSGDHLSVTTSGGAKYEIYYQYASISEQTELAVPENLPYTVSGDNVAGFIITVALS